MFMRTWKEFDRNKSECNNEFELNPCKIIDFFTFLSQEKKTIWVWTEHVFDIDNSSVAWLYERSCNVFDSLLILTDQSIHLNHQVPL